MYNERREREDDPCGYVLNLIPNTRYPTSRYIHELLNENIDHEKHRINEIIRKIETSTSSRRITYRTITNPDLQSSELYEKDIDILESVRISFTRYRLISHSLAVETGRWNRRGRGRLPLEDRLCPCGAVQTEEHVVMNCPNTQHLRQKYNLNTINDLNDHTIDIQRKALFIDEILKTYM